MLYKFNIFQLTIKKISVISRKNLIGIYKPIFAQCGVGVALKIVTYTYVWKCSFHYFYEKIENWLKSTDDLRSYILKMNHHRPYFERKCPWSFFTNNILLISSPYEKLQWHIKISNWLTSFMLSKFMSYCTIFVSEGNFIY